MTEWAQAISARPPTHLTGAARRVSNFQHKSEPWSHCHDTETLCPGTGSSTDLSEHGKQSQMGQASYLEMIIWSNLWDLLQGRTNAKDGSQLYCSSFLTFLWLSSTAFNNSTKVHLDMGYRPLVDVSVCDQDYHQKWTQIMTHWRSDSDVSAAHGGGCVGCQ